MSSNKKNVHRLNVRPMAVRLDTLIPTVPPQDITTTSEVGITDKKEDSQIKNDSTAAVEDVEVSLNNEDMQVWYRPAYLTDYHVRLPATAFLETASSSSSSPNTDNNAYHTAKNELDTFLRSLHSADKDQDNFFFSKCPLDQCVWYGKRIDAMGYSEVDVAIYEDYPSFSTDIIVEVCYQMGDYKVFLALFESIKNWAATKGSPQDSHTNTDNNNVGNNDPLTMALLKGLPPVVLNREHILASIRQMVLFIKDSKHDEMKIIYLNKVPLIVKFASLLHSCELAMDLVNVLHPLVTMDTFRKNPLLFEFAMIAVTSLCDDNTFLTMFGQDVKMIETILYFLSMISKDQEFYFQFVQTTRLCCLLLWKWKNHNATSENVTKMLKNTLPSIELNHSNGDGRLEELISKLSR